MAVDTDAPVEKKTITVQYTEWGEYHYFASFGVSFGYRSVETTDTNIYVNKIWADGELWFDRNVSEIKPGLKFYFLPGTSDQMPPPGIEIAYRDQIILWFDSVDLGTQGQLPTISAEFIDEADATVADALRNIALRAGYVADDIVISPSLEEIALIGYIVDSTGTLEGISTDLGYLYDFVFVESSGQAHFVQSYDTGGEFVVTFDIGDGLAVLREGGQGQQIDAIAIQSEQSLPSSITATYFDIDANYAAGTQTASKREVFGAQSSVSLSLPVVMSGTEMRSRLFDALARSYDEANGHSIRVPSKFMQLEAGDTVQFNVYGTIYLANVMTATLNNDWSVSLGLSERGADRSHTPVDTQPPATPVTTINPKSIKTVIMDIPDTDPSQTVDGFLNYRVALGSDVPGQWKGGRFDIAPTDNMNNWVPVFVAGRNDEAGIGSLFAFDNADTMRFDMKNFSEAHLVARRGSLMIVGSQARYEILRYAEISFSHGVATATGLTRGMYGTDDWIDRHAAADTVVLYDDTYPVQYTVDDYRAERQFVYRGVAAFQKVENAPTGLYSPSANSRKPYSPNNLHVVKELDGTLTVTWTKDTARIAYGFADETEEAYSLYVFDNDWKVVRRVLGIVGTQYDYTPESQTIDNFTADPISHMLVFQLSSVIGLGFPGGGSPSTSQRGVLAARIGPVKGFRVRPPLKGRYGPVRGLLVDLNAGKAVISLAAHIGGVRGLHGDLHTSPWRAVFGPVAGLSGSLAPFELTTIRRRMVGFVAGDDATPRTLDVGTVRHADMVVVHEMAIGPAAHVFTDREGYTILGTVDNRAINQQWGRVSYYRPSTTQVDFEVDLGSYTADHQLEWHVTQVFVVANVNFDPHTGELLNFAMQSVTTDPLSHILVTGSTHHIAPSLVGNIDQFMLAMTGTSLQRSYVGPVGMNDMGYRTSHNDDVPAVEFGGDFGGTVDAAYRTLTAIGSTGGKDFTFAWWNDFITASIIFAYGVPPPPPDPVFTWGAVPIYANEQTTAGFSINITYPYGSGDGDEIFVWLVREGDSVSPSVPPAGFTLLDHQAFGDPGGFWLYHRKLDVTFSDVAIDVTWVASGSIWANVIRVPSNRGLDGQSRYYVDGGFGSDVVLPSITTTKDGDLILAFIGANGFAFDINTPPTSFTNIASEAHAQTGAKRQTAAGATGTVTWAVYEGIARRGGVLVAVKANIATPMALEATVGPIVGVLASLAAGAALSARVGPVGGLHANLTVVGETQFLVAHIGPVVGMTADLTVSTPDLGDHITYSGGDEVTYNGDKVVY